jgi:hypothetical protein
MQIFLFFVKKANGGWMKKLFHGFGGNREVKTTAVAAI